MMLNKTILFDINETVLNLEYLKPKFKNIFGNENALPLWFSKLLHSSTVCIATDLSSNFTELASAMLKSIAVTYNCKLTKSQHDELLSSFASLPPHSDVKESLTKLRSNGFRVIAFTNSSKDFVSSQLKNAGLTTFFDKIISVEETGSFKPDLKVYEFAAKVIDEPMENLCLIAAHDWDTHGALSAGLKAAYIDRTGNPYNPCYLKPNIQSNNMLDIVNQIITNQK